MVGHCRLGLLAMLACAGVACVPVYLPPAANAPLLGHRGELDLAGQGSLFGYDLQAAFVPVDNIGITGTASIGTGDTEHLQGEAAAGFVTAFGGIGRFNVFAGGGGGRSRGKMDLTIEGTKQTFVAAGSFMRAFLQADLGMVHEIVDVGVSVKAAYVRYNYTEYQATPPLDRAENVFIEPYGFLRLGYEWLKAEMQVGAILPTRGIEPQSFPLNLSLGIHVKFNALGGDEPWGATHPEPADEAPPRRAPPPARREPESTAVPPAPEPGLDTR